MDEKKKKEPEYLSRLDPFTEEARAGVPDGWIATQSGVEVRLVAAWRRKRGIKVSTAAREQLEALRGLGQRFEATPHEVTGPQGLWEPPAFVLREPLDYTSFARYVHHLQTYLGATDAQLSAALGVRDQDIRYAVMLWRRHLRRNGKPCLNCPVVIDPRFGDYCTKRCADEALKAFST